MIICIALVIYPYMAFNILIQGFNKVVKRWLCLEDYKWQGYMSTDLHRPPTVQYSMHHICFHSFIHGWANFRISFVLGTKDVTLTGLRDPVLEIWKFKKKKKKTITGIASQHGRRLEDVWRQVGAHECIVDINVSNGTLLGIKLLK